MQPAHFCKRDWRIRLLDGLIRPDIWCRSHRPPVGIKIGAGHRSARATINWQSPDPGVLRWQDRMTPVWKRFTGGCHLNRKIDELITAAGFEIVELKTCYLPGPRPMTFNYQGQASRR